LFFHPILSIAVALICSLAGGVPGLRRHAFDVDT
jgi:hypothetical protein